MRASWIKRAAILLFLFVCGVSARADLALSYSWGPTNLNVGGNITCTVTVANTNPIVVLTPTITMSFPTSGILVSATNVPSSSIVTTTTATNATQVIFSMSQLPGNTSSTATLVLQTTRAGSFNVSVTTTANGYTPVAQDLPVVVGSAKTDLSLSVTAIPSAAIENDYISWSTTVTNAGPSDATGVTVTTAMPTNATIIAVSPTGHHTVANHVLTYTVGALTNKQTAQFTVTASVASGTNTFTNTVQAADVADTSAANDTVTATLVAAPYVPANIQILNVADFTWNQSKALFDQVVTIKNVSTTNLSNVHLIATNLSGSNRLWYGNGTNAGHSFILLTTNLNAGQTIDVLSEVFFTNRQAFIVNYAGAGIPVPGSGGSTNNTSTNTTSTNITTFPPFPTLTFTNTVALGTNGTLIMATDFTNVFNVTTNGIVIFNVSGATNSTYAVLYSTNVDDLILPATNATRTASVTAATDGKVTIVPPVPPAPSSTNASPRLFYRLIQTQ